MSKKNIYLIGFMGVGKSTIARELQEKLHMERIEMDQAIVEQQGMPISELFERFGEEHFRDIESAFVKNLKDAKASIVSCGGGAVLREQNAGAMKRDGRIVLLTARPETIYNRVKDSRDRPILNGNMNMEYIEELMMKRRPRYEEVADIIIETDGKTAKSICDEVAERLYGDS